MKNHKFLLLGLISLMSQFSYSDIILPGYHGIDKCVMITNIDDFPTVDLIRYTDAFGTISSYIVGSSVCMHGEYWAYEHYLYAANKSYLSNKDLNSIDFKNDRNLRKSSLLIQTYGDKVPDSNPIIAINELYKIIGFTDTTVVLHKWQATFKFNNGKKDSTVTYVSPIPTGINYSQSLNGTLVLYPNPAKESFNIKIDNDFCGQFSVRIISFEGKIISTFNLEKANYNFNCLVNTEKLHKGSYFVKIMMGGKSVTRKIIIN